MRVPTEIQSVWRGFGWSGFLATWVGGKLLKTLGMKSVVAGVAAVQLV